MPESAESTRLSPPEAQSGRDRLKAALTSRPARGQVIVAALLAVVGFGAMTQVRSHEKDNQYAGLRQADLIRVFDGLSASSQRAESQIAELTERRDQLRSESSSKEAALEQARQDAATYGILAGTLPAGGPGVRITVTDERGGVEAGILLDALQELRAAGAEAIEVNDRVRVIAQTSIEEGDGGIVIDDELVEAPYVFDVIGEPTTLAGSLDFPDGPVEVVGEQGGSVSFESRDEVLVESVVTTREPDFAEPRD